MDMNGVAERFILLALDPSTGEPLTQAGFADVAIAGAFLADLSLRDRIAISDDTVVVTDDSPTGSTALDACITTIGEKPRDAGALITAFCPIAHRRRDEVFVEAEQAGLVEHLTRRHLWLYTTHRYKP
ncbi:MAG: GPP34 family phosphoprotein, partial [Corynebacteriales bacterium]|nr:GPP34 family phosphoprotein [Mycobacteriales bacterium]